MKYLRKRRHYCLCARAIEVHLIVSISHHFLLCLFLATLTVPTVQNLQYSLNPASDSSPSALPLVLFCRNSYCLHALYSILFSSTNKQIKINSLPTEIGLQDLFLVLVKFGVECGSAPSETFFFRLLAK